MKIRINKSLVTNLIAIIIIATAYWIPHRGELLKSVGFFALSGAITNWLAIFMLFEKVPLLYGSGVIPNRFEEFKTSIKALMMEQFFTPQNIEQFIEKEEQQGSHVLNLDPLLNAVDYDRIYQGLVSTIMESSFGSMLQMMGGVDALEPLKEPFKNKIQTILSEIVESERFASALQHSLNAEKISNDITHRIEAVIDKRLNELTPEQIKEIVQTIIREHLGWLVVWGGVFGGLLGAIFSFI